MQALSDDQPVAAIEAKVDQLEAKIDAGFAEMRGQIKSTEVALRTEIDAVRSDARSDFRTMLALVVSLWAATVLTVLAAHL